MLGLMLERLELSTALLDADITRLSTGERQRMTLVRSLDADPRVLLLAEPPPHSIPLPRWRSRRCWSSVCGPASQSSSSRIRASRPHAWATGCSRCATANSSRPDADLARCRDSRMRPPRASFPRTRSSSRRCATSLVSTWKHRSRRRTVTSKRSRMPRPITASTAPTLESDRGQRRGRSRPAAAAGGW